MAGLPPRPRVQASSGRRRAAHAAQKPGWLLVLTSVRRGTVAHPSNQQPLPSPLLDTSCGLHRSARLTSASAQHISVRLPAENARE
jgi:hypothetical protein